MLNAVDLEFHNLYGRLLESGHIKDDRTAVGTIMLPAQMMRFDTSNGKLPILSTRAIPTKSFRIEMLKLFVAGTSSIKGLRDEKIGIWDGWFIKGTDRYEEPIPYSYTEMVALAIETHGAAKIKELLISCSRAVGDSDTVYDDTVCEALVADYGVPLNKFEPKPISLHRRLARVSKNDINAWTVIDIAMDGFGETNEVDEKIKLVVFNPSVKKFGEIEFPIKFTEQLLDILDKLEIPKYELLDADIGQGSYGVNWRHWQDTQLIEVDQIEQFEAEGYQIVTQVDKVTDGPFFGKVVVHREIDQLQEMINKLRYKPDDRRNIVSAWNVGRVWQAALPPCHLYFQCVSWEMDAKDLEQQLINTDMISKLFTSLLTAPDDFDSSDPEQSLEYMRKFCIDNNLPTRKMSMFVLLRS